MTPPYGLRADGPLMAGACAGAASGAGTRFWKAGVAGACDPSSVEGFRTTPVRPNPPCPKPPRAKPGVDPTTQAVANNSIVKTRFMIVVLIRCHPTAASHLIAAVGTASSLF